VWVLYAWCCDVNGRKSSRWTLHNEKTRLLGVHATGSDTTPHSQQLIITIDSCQFNKSYVMCIWIWLWYWLAQTIACKSSQMTANSSSVSRKVEIRYPQSKKWGYRYPSYPRKLNAYGLSSIADYRTRGLSPFGGGRIKKTTAINALVWHALHTPSRI